MNGSVRVVMDDALTEIGMIFCGSGRNTVTIEMDIADLIRMVDPLICKIKKE